MPFTRMGPHWGLARIVVVIVIGTALAALSVVALAAESTRHQLKQVLSATPAPDYGRELFRTCAVCHGNQGSGTPDGSVPAIAGQHFTVIAKQLIDYRHARRWDIRMEHMADQHLLAGSQEIADVASYISELPAKVAVQFGDGALLARGASVFVESCQKCHQPRAEGNAAQYVPRLAGQHYDYLLRQLYDVVEGRRPNMTGTHRRLVARLDHDQLVGVADYLSRLAPPTPELQTAR